jgi:hypothetical protein
MKDIKTEDLSKEGNEKSSLTPEPVKDQKAVPEKTEVKNANAAGLGAIGRTGEKPGPEMDENMHY